MDPSLILSACRTPITKFTGALAAVDATDLGALVVNGALCRADLPAEDVDEVILGNVLSSGLGQAPARQAALNGGLPHSVAAMTINKVCGSGLKAIMLADQVIRAGDADVIIAGGMENMSRAPYLLERGSAKLGNRTLIDSMLHDGLVCPFSGDAMGAIADRVAVAEGISRDDQDRWALESHRRASAATDSGDFEEEIVRVPVPDRGGIVTVASDEGPRRDTTLQGLAELRPAFDPQGTVTPGNASMISDGAAALVVVSRRHAEKIGKRPMARIVASATVGSAPEDLFLSPVAAVRKVLKLAGLVQSDIGLFEISEAFAAQVLACLERLQLPPEQVNVRGGAIALGHPIGASGARLLVTLLHAMRRRHVQRGLAVACLGGGNSVAMIVEQESS